MGTFIFALILLVLILLAISWIVTPHGEYNKKLPPIHFYYSLGYGKKVTSHGNVVLVAREFIDSGDLIPPQEVEKQFAKLYAEYKERHPVRCQFIKQHEFHQYYTIRLMNRSSWMEHHVTYEQIIGYDPDLERSLMTNSLRQLIYERDGYFCAHCGEDSSYAEFHIDHVQPISLGGKTTPDNLQVLCKTCNLSKGNRFIG